MLGVLLSLNILIYICAVIKKNRWIFCIPVKEYSSTHRPISFKSISVSRILVKIIHKFKCSLYYIRIIIHSSRHDIITRKNINYTQKSKATNNDDKISKS